MDKRTLLAVILSVVIVSVSFFIQNILWPPKVVNEEVANQETVQKEDIPNVEVQSPSEVVDYSDTTFSEESLDSAPEQKIIEENDIFRIEFLSKGAVVTSLKLKKHTDGNDYVEMVNKGESDYSAFGITLGQKYGRPLDENFVYRKVSDNIFEFRQRFNDKSGIPFVLKKTYRFLPNEYLMELAITIEGSNNQIPDLDFNGSAYRLEYGPQIGPYFEKLDNRNEYRNYYYHIDDKRKKLKLKNNEVEVNDHVDWVAIDGKYFSLIAIPDDTNYDITVSSVPVRGMEKTSRLILSRPLLKASKSTDIFRFYIGPKSVSTLSQYNNASDNGYGVSNLNLDDLIKKNILLGALETVLKFFLEMFYSIVHNYGVAIILLTFLVRLVLYPITRKSYQSTAAMQAVQPKITEIREKFKDDPNKMNMAMADLYKKEGVNPLGGCLPMVLQLPIFFALYRLLNSHFDLRGAAFISPWISDLSAPEHVFSWSGVTLPVVGNDFRILPFLMVITQIVMTKITQSQNTGATSDSQMKMLTYGMPIFFFFIMYDMPSGLLLYWTVTNVLSAVQQIVINKMVKKKKA
ncbi:membrane protein insertase YidC [Spirochaeta cellobiosiphila]|uniref:membrane protein insertase YidC n=1 Tax=Spirochaeta cellobiosiphila TaxID=504483 RepID=UPI00040632B4|nr:membrane protein insertase YidC [Spirochaeta cellobiosiphila]